MSGDRSIHIGRDAAGNVIATGDHNQVDATIESKLVKVSLPPASSVDISKELSEIRAILGRIGGEHVSKIERALDDAAEEAGKTQPNKNEIGSALNRAIEYAKTGTAFTEVVQKLVPHITNAVGWLGSNWHKLLALVGLVV